MSQLTLEIRYVKHNSAQHRISHSEAPWKLALFDLGMSATSIALDSGNVLQKSLTKSKEKLRANLSSQKPVR